MRPEDAQKLLGGYATGTLTGPERQALYQAALDNQELFNALAGEQALKELLDDPVARRRLLDALGRKKEPPVSRLAACFSRPASWAIAGAAVTTILIAVFVSRTLSRQAVVHEVAMNAPKAVEPAPRLRDQPAPARKAGLEERKSSAPLAAEQPATGAKDIAVVRKEKAAIAPSAPAVGVAGGFGGVPGGVVGGIVSQPAPAPAVAAPREAAKEAAPRSVGAAAEIGADLAQVAAAQPRVLRCGIERTDASGQFVEVDSRTVFREGDRLRVTVQTEEDGYLNVLLRDSGQRQTLLFRQRVEHGKRYSVPAGEPLLLEGPTGELTFVAAFSRQPPAALEGLATAVVRAQRRDEDRRANRPAQAAAVTDKLSGAPVVVEIPVLWK